MSCGIRGYLRTANSGCSFLGRSLTFLRNDSDHMRNYRTQYHSLNMYSRGNFKSYAVIYFVILIKACGIANSTEGRHVRCFCSCRMVKSLTQQIHLCSKMLDNVLPIIIHVLWDLCLVKLFYMLLNEQGRHL